MEFNQNQIQGKWLEIKGEVQKAWGKLTDDELDKTKGDAKAISGLIQQRYGEAEEKSKQKLDDIFSRFNRTKDKATDNIKENLKT